MIVDPAVLRDVADLLRDNPKILARIHAGWAPSHKRLGLVAGFTVKVAVTGTAALAGLYGLVLFVAGLYTPFVVMTTGAALMIVALLLRPRPDAEVERRHALERLVHDRSREYDGRYVLHEQLDEPARALMSRAQAAVEQVMDSRVNVEGLLDDARNAVMLPVHEWEIARLLAKLSELRGERQEVVSEGVTPEVAAVADALAEALARVEALERYAGHVADAERAYRARRQIERLSATLPRYEELLAESGAHGSAVPELGGLSDDADRLEQALRDSVSSAHEAFRHLRG
ncbi:hypothetical protein ETD86_16305 [Nonomuraea turkmeniaca]|uniref:Uncharacterized protein n=1 Tax=Nonomuraea turkmeniaca TaxID=103838 RepID=A0A5S4FL35_9ACTN|nr:hypothetical protein ETD86_16305 [Nonomuraea turkmeniaca]